MRPQETRGETIAWAGIWLSFAVISVTVIWWWFAAASGS